MVDICQSCRKNKSKMKATTHYRQQLTWTLRTMLPWPEITAQSTQFSIISVAFAVVKESAQFVARLSQESAQFVARVGTICRKSRHSLSRESAQFVTIVGTVSRKSQHSLSHANQLSLPRL